MPRVDLFQFRPFGPEELDRLHEIMADIFKTTLLDPCSNIGQLNKHLVEVRRLVLPVAFRGPEASF